MKQAKCCNAGQDTDDEKVPATLERGQYNTRTVTKAWQGLDKEIGKEWQRVASLRNTWGPGRRVPLDVGWGGGGRDKHKNTWG